MAIETDDRDSAQARRTWMIQEFQQAQQRRRSAAATPAGAVEPREPAVSTSDVPVAPDDRSAETR